MSSHNYINFDLFNNSRENMPVIANVYSTSPIVKSGRKYQAIVIRSQIPLMNVEICSKNDIKDLQIAVVNKSTGLGDKKSIFDVWTEQNSMANGGVFSISHFVSLLNAALQACRPGAVAAADFFKVSLEGDSFKISVKKTVNDDYKIYGNSLFYSLFGAGFSTFFVSPERIELKLDNHTPSTSDGTNLTFTQESSTVTNCFMNDTVIVQSDLPVLQEKSGNFDQGAANSQPVTMLTDFALTSNLKSSAIVVPQVERVINCLSSIDTFSTHIKIVYRNKSGTIKQLTMPPGSHFNLKLCLREII